MVGVIHIVVAMKPAQGGFVENALKNGVAGLNIDGCRIGTEQRIWRGSGVSQQRYSDGRAGLTDGRGKELEFSSTGRWPANLILGHSEDCRCVGMKKVKGNPHLGQKNPDLTKQYGGGSFGGGVVKPNSGYSDEEGNETIEDWQCVEDCPIRLMDEQSGDRPAGAWNRTAGARPFNNDGRDTEYHEWQKIEDSGGASRFFKQVRRCEYEDAGSK